MSGKLPKISVITPTLNQGKFIEKTIISVLEQDYPDLEYIVVDGGSTDNTLKILRGYTRRLKYTSSRDNGQSDAINRGLKKSTGDIVCYLNSDDFLAPGALFKVGAYFNENSKAKWLTGKCRVVDETGAEVRRFITVYKNFFLRFLRARRVFSVVQFISQPSTFWKKEIFDVVGPFSENLNYDMDYDYWLRIWRQYPPHFINDYLSNYRVHKNAKAVVSPETQFRVQYEIIRRYEKNPLVLLLHLLHAKLSLLVYRLFLLN